MGTGSVTPGCTRNLDPGRPAPKEPRRAAVTLRPVLRFRRRLRLFTWLALFAMLGLAVAPSVSYALSAGNASNPFTEICSASPSGTAPSGNTGSAAMHLEHCALCCIAAQHMGMPPAPATPLPAPEGADYVAARFLDASRTLFAWTAAQARAPPRFS